MVSLTKLDSSAAAAAGATAPSTARTEDTAPQTARVTYLETPRHVIAFPLPTASGQNSARKRLELNLRPGAKKVTYVVIAPNHAGADSFERFSGLAAEFLRRNPRYGDTSGSLQPQPPQPPIHVHTQTNGLQTTTIPHLPFASAPPQPHAQPHPNTTVQSHPPKSAQQLLQHSGMHALPPSTTAQKNPLPPVARASAFAQPSPSQRQTYAELREAAKRRNSQTATETATTPPAKGQIYVQPQPPVLHAQVSPASGSTHQQQPQPTAAATGAAPAAPQQPVVPGHLQENPGQPAQPTSCWDSCALM